MRYSSMNRSLVQQDPIQPWKRHHRWLEVEAHVVLAQAVIISSRDLGANTVELQIRLDLSPRSPDLVSKKHQLWHQTLMATSISALPSRYLYNSRARIKRHHSNFRVTIQALSHMTCQNESRLVVQQQQQLLRLLQIMLPGSKESQIMVLMA